MPRKSQIIPSDAKHGIYGTYTWGCRCRPCKDAHATYMRAYTRRPEAQTRLEHKRERVRREIARIKLEKGCMDCGYNTRFEALEFDHRPGTNKLFTISGGLLRTWSSLEIEMAKCDVVCANCHRIRTVSRAKKNRY